MRSASYIYLITRAHGLSTHLFNAEDFRALARTRDLNSFVESVSRGDYAEKIGLLSRESITARELNKVFSEVYVDRLLYLLKVAPEPVNKFLDAYTRRVEVDNVKRILVAKFHGLSLAVDDLIPLPRTYSVINYQAMIEAESLEDAVTLLMFTKYREVGNYISIAREYGSTIPLEAYLDRVYYKNVVKYIERLPDKGVVRNIIGFEIDLRNLYFIVAYKLLGAPQELIEETILRPFYRLTDEYINNLLRARAETLLDSFMSTPYGWASSYVAEALEEGSVADLEYGINLILSNFLKSMSTRNALGLGYVIWYLNAIYFEYRNLTTIAFAKELSIPEEEIKLVI